MKAITQDRWLSVEEIADYLGVKRDKLYKWSERKKMPAHKVGILWTFKREEIDAGVCSREARDRRTEHADDN